MKNQKIFAVSFFFSLIPSMCFAQEGTLTWENVNSLAISRGQAVKTCFIQGEIEYFHASEIRKAKNEEWQRNHVGEGVADENELRVFSWSNAGIKWRVDTQRLYPALRVGRAQLCYDGEKYYSLNEIQSGTDTGAVGSERLQAAIPDSWSEDDFTTFSSATVFGSGLVRNLETSWCTDKQAPTFEKEEVISGYKCQKFVHHQVDPQNSTSYDMEMWFSPELKIAVKAVVSTSTPRKEGPALVSTNLYIVQRAEQFSNIWIPVETKIEIYSNRQLKKTANFAWLVTKVIKANTVHINEPNYLTVFQRPFAIGTFFVDLLENPGTFQVTGGAADIGEDIRAVRLGTPPPLELPDIQPHGEAPEVVQVQRAIEEAQLKGEDLP